jgi:creatinine amidohydrolase
MECYWNRNTESTLAALRRASAGVAVIPLASIESHGPHLPLGSDTHCIDHVVSLVLRKETVAVLPTLQYTHVASARSRPGGVNLASDLLMDMVENLCDEIHRNGFDKIVLLHGHGGNVFLGEAFVRRMLERDKPYALYSIPVLPGIGMELRALMESEHIGHACEFETSLNMAACPGLVDLKALGKRTFTPLPGPEVGVAITPVDWIARHPEMFKGEPQKATPEKGEKIATLWSDAIIKHLRLIKRDRLTARAMKNCARLAHSIGSKKSRK